MEAYIYIIILIALSVLVVVLKPKIKGWFGEKAVAVILSGLDNENYKVINDVMLKTSKGTSQIDHIVVSVYGIFVIETKNYKGWITGTEYAEQWTKNMYGQKYKFRNPILQNYGHVKALQQLLELKEDDFIPIVVFSVDADIKIKSSKHIVYTVQLNKVIRKYKDIKFSLEEVRLFADKIANANISSYDTRREHVSKIKTEITEKQNKINNKICPKCGAVLVERNGKYGKFTGCSNYPKCKYTIK